MNVTSQSNTLTVPLIKREEIRLCDRFRTATAPIGHTLFTERPWCSVNLVVRASR